MKALSVMVFISVLICGCAIQDLSGDTYTRKEARSVQAVEQGTVLEVNPVVIEGQTDGFAGTAGGGVIGGIAGSTIGGGRGSRIASTVGAIAGSIIGQKTEERLTRKQGQEIMVERATGATIVVVQEVVGGKFFEPGDRVRIISSPAGTRIRY